MRKAIGVCILILSLFMWTHNSQGYTIIDNYWGAKDHGYGDVIGSEAYFDISKMEVNYSGGNLTVDIYSRYFNNIGVYDTSLGDLFISTNGWNPYGTPPYPQDNYINGEAWEYVLVLNDHNATSGTLNLYKISDGGSVVISYGPGPYGYIWRDGQEVQFSPSGPSKATGAWDIIYGLSTADTDDYLRFTINYTDWEGGNPYAFHWATTCGNDTIEGAVPEPATMLLLGSGLIGLAGLGRKKFFKK